MTIVRRSSIVDAISLRFVAALGARLERAHAAIARATVPRCATAGPGLAIQLAREVRLLERIHLGRNVKLGPGSVLKPCTRDPGGWLRHPDGDHREQAFEPELRVGDRVTATAALQVAVFRCVVVEDEVMVAANVFIANGTHARTRGDVPPQSAAVGAPARVAECWHPEQGTWVPVAATHGQGAIVAGAPS